jgi:peptidoglycan-N-acetylglucosamine deacetylase
MIFSVSVDLDPLFCYREIFGLPAAKEEQDPVVPVALPRFCDLMRTMGGKGTVFVVGKSMKEKAAMKAVLDARDEGHEIANHSYSHRYDLSKLSAEEMSEEIGRGAEAIEKTCGRRPAGFRAPGYLLGSGLLNAAIREGAEYDSSILPSLLYKGVKASVMGWLSLRGRKSGAILGDPREALAPHRPYRPDPESPFRIGNAPLLEMPITSVLGVPLTGATLTLGGTTGVGVMAVLAGRLGFVNMELHGIDFLDFESDGIDPSLSLQRDLHIPWQRKVQTIGMFIEKMLRSHRMMTLGEAATWLSEKNP